MRRFQNLLYVTRGTAGQIDALKQALALARNNGAELHALVVSPVLPKKLETHEASYETSLAERIEADIANAQSELKMNPDEVSVSVAVECGDTPAVRIVRRVLRGAHDLLVKESEPDVRQGFRALDMELLRSCPCPVWLCRPISRSGPEIRVAAAVEPQTSEAAARDLALQLLQLARSLADSCNGELDIISCWDFAFENDFRNSPWTTMSEEALTETIDTTEREHLDALQEVIRESGIGGRIRVHHARGRPDQTIPKLVDTLDIDVLVMGTVARTGLQGFIMGNTAENVLREIRCSLVALKPNGFVSPIQAY
jgi:universal stress protein E